MSDLDGFPTDYRKALAVAAAVVVGLGVFELRMRTVARAQAIEVVEADREKFKADAIEAARQGADKAVRESVVPLMLSVTAHHAQDTQTQQETDRRLDALERRAK